jgi:deoxyribonuclease V
MRKDRRLWYNRTMHVERLHSWNVDVPRAREIQNTLADQVIQRDCLERLSLIAGVDVSVERSGQAVAAAVILSYPDLEVVEKAVLRDKVTFPYVPGYLSFREVPITLNVLEMLTHRPDLVMVDGQGRAHPRHCGLASHLGLCLDLPTIGCAKSHLCGRYEEPRETAGSYSSMLDDLDETIGAVVRTRGHVKPLFISVGHKITLASAIKWVLLCCRGVRLPEPTRKAHLASRGIL